MILRVGQRRAGIRAGDLRVVPARDRAEEDPGVGLARQLELAGAPGQVVGQHDAAGRHRQQHHAVLHRGDLLVGHRRVAGAEVDQAVRELLDAGAAAERLVVDLHLRVHLVELGEPPLVERRREGRARSLQGHVGRPDRAAERHGGERHGERSSRTLVSRSHHLHVLSHPFSRDGVCRTRGAAQLSMAMRSSGFRPDDNCVSAVRQSGDTAPEPGRRSG